MKTDIRYTVVGVGVCVLLVSALMLHAAEKSRPRAAMPAPKASGLSTSRPAGNLPRSQSLTSRPAGASSRPSTAPAALSTQSSATTVTVYYFHRTMRCPTCMRIEQLARDAVQHGFENEVAVGTVKWEAINLERPGSAHFEKDFGLKVQSLVIAKSTAGRPQEWTNMTEIWDLVSDPLAFTKYVHKGVRRYLEAGPASRP